MNDKLYIKVRDKFGLRHQIIKAVEEMGELSCALSKWLNEDDALPSDVQGEIADVTIMMEQMRLAFFPAVVDRKKQEKLERLETLI